MVEAADFSGLQAWADAMAVILLLELCVLLVMVAVLVGVLAYAARWLQMHVLPVLNTTVPVARTALEKADEGTDVVVRGVAEVYGIRRALETGLRVLVYGREGAARRLDARGGGEAEPGAARREARAEVMGGARGTPAPRPAPPAEERRETRPDGGMTAHAG
jgi:hypothetical protein